MLNLSILQFLFIAFTLIIPPTLLILAIYDLKELKEELEKLK